MGKAANASNVTAGKPKIAGGIYCAPKGTTLPTDSTTALGDAFNLLGYISEDGVTNSNSPESSTVNAWGGYSVLTLSTGRPDTFNWTMIEAMNTDVLKVVHGEENVSGSLAEGISVEVGPGALEEHVYVIDMILTDNATKRIVIPAGQLQSVGDVSYSDGSAVGYQVTINAAPDASGKTHYEYIKAAA